LLPSGPGGVGDYAVSQCKYNKILFNLQKVNYLIKLDINLSKKKSDEFA